MPYVLTVHASQMPQDGVRLDQFRPILQSEGWTLAVQLDKQQKHDIITPRELFPHLLLSEQWSHR